MTTSRVNRRSRPPGRRAGIGSLLMIPAIAVSFTVAELVGSASQSALGLDANESLTAAGALGVVVAVALAILLVVPQAFGIVLGAQARRLGATRIGTTGLALNGVIAAFTLLTVAVNLLFL